MKVVGVNNVKVFALGVLDGDGAVADLEEDILAVVRRLTDCAVDADGVLAAVTDDYNVAVGIREKYDRRKIIFDTSARSRASILSSTD